MGWSNEGNGQPVCQCRSPTVFLVRLPNPAPVSPKEGGHQQGGSARTEFRKCVVPGYLRHGESSSRTANRNHPASSLFSGVMVILTTDLRKSTFAYGSGRLLICLRKFMSDNKHYGKSWSGSASDSSMWSSQFPSRKAGKPLQLRLSEKGRVRNLEGGYPRRPE